MGTFFYPITLIGPSGRRKGTVEALVDTGATFTSVPADILEELGVPTTAPNYSTCVYLMAALTYPRPLGRTR